MSLMDTRQKIIRAAIELFAERGKHGARMEEVARRAKVNKAMVYYYFSEKDNLYGEVLKAVFLDLFTSVERKVDRIIASFTSPVEILREFIKAYFGIVSSKRYAIVKLVLGALVNEPELVQHAVAEVASTGKGPPIGKIASVFEEGVRKGVLRRIDPRQALVNIVGTTFVYFIGKPIATISFALSPQEEASFERSRPEAIVDLALNGLVAVPSLPRAQRRGR